LLVDVKLVGEVGHGTSPCTKSLTISAQPLLRASRTASQHQNPVRSGRCFAIDAS
jgi:hypothetical protein